MLWGFAEQFGYPVGPWLVAGGAVGLVSLLIAWLYLRRRYAALADSDVAARLPAGPGPQALRERLMLTFFRHDPASLTPDDRRPDAYAAEVDRLIQALPGLRTEPQVRSFIHGILVSGFDSAPEPFDESLHALTSEVWAVWGEWSSANRR